MAKGKAVKEFDCGAFEAALEKLHEDVRSIKKQLEGNGDPGLMEQAMLNTAHRVRMEKLIDGLWLKVLLIWITTIGTIAALIQFLAGK